MLAVILAFATTGCIALAAMSDLVSNFLSMVVMVIARIILQLCDLIMNPLLEITQMTTEEVAEYIPGFAMSGDGVGGYFAKAIMVIATTIAGALIAVRIISYLLEIADGARTESVAKLIWNAVFGMVLTLTGSHFLQLMFDEIISPLTKALSEGVSGGGLGDFSFEKAGMSIIDLTESGDTTETIIAWMGGFMLAQAAALVVSVVLLFLIWWNLVKLVLECAERYIICVFTILLSPLAFATATNERTKDTAINWMQMFWSQCVLLILNIWVVGIARTALDIGLVGASIDSVVKWGLITYAYLKIAQKLDDLLAKAGFRITSTTGLDPMSEAIGAFSVLKTGAHDILSLAGGVAGRGRAAFEALSSFIGGADNSPPIATNPVTPAGPGGAPSGSSSDFNKYGKVSFGDKEKADRFVRSTNAERSDIYKNPGETFNSNSNRQAMANALDELGFDGGKVSQGTVEDLAPDNAIKGAVNGKVTYRDENGKITGVSGFRYSSDESGTTATKTSDLAISPDGQSAILTTDKGKFRLENTGRTAANGSQEWTATRMTDGKGRNLGDVIPDTKNSTSFSVPAGQLNKYGADGAAAIAARSAMEGKNLDYLTRTTDSALNKHDQEQAAAVARDAKQAEAQKQFDTAKENYAGRFQMSNEQRAAEMRDPDSAVDYNSPESLAAMQDTLANADPALAEQFANGAKVTGVDMAMGRDDMPDGALTVTVGDGNTTDTYMVSNPKSSLTDEEAAQVIASGQLPNETAQNAENADGVAGGPNNASAAENGTDAAKTEAAMPDEDGNIAYNSLAGDDNEQEVTGEEVGDTVGMTSEAFEAMHTPMTWMDEPEADESEAGAPPTMWEYFAAMFSGRYSRNNSAQPTYVHVVNPDGVNYKSGAAAPNAANAANGTTTNANGTGKAAAGSGAPTDEGAPTPQNATASATGATGSVNTAQNGNTTDATSTTVGGAVSRFFGGGNTQAVHNPDVSGKDSNATTTETATAPNAANTTNGTTINANGADNTAVGGTAPRASGANNVNVVNPDAVGSSSGSTKPTSTPVGAPTANGTADSKPINAANANTTVTGASAPGNASSASTNAPQGKSGDGTPTDATVKGSATPLTHEGNAPIDGSGTAANKGNGPAPTPEAVPTPKAGTAEGKVAGPAPAPTLETTPAGKNGVAPEQGIGPAPAAGNGTVPAPTPETAPTAKGQSNAPSANVNGAGEGNTAPTGTAGTTAAEGTAPTPSNAGTLPTEPAGSGSDATVAPGAQEQNVSTKSAPSSESQGNSEIYTGGNGVDGEGNTVVISSPAQGSNATQAKDTTPSEHVETETFADSSATSTVTQSASEDSITDSNAGQTETVVGGGSVGPATQSATDKTVTEEGPAPTTAPASPNNSDSAANDSTASVESPAGNAPGEEVAGPAKQATSHGSADAEYTGSETPTGNGAINEGSSSVGSEVQLVDDSSDTVQTNAPAQTENAAGAAANDSATGDASADYAEPPADAGNASGNGAVTENSGSADSETQFTDDSSATVQANAPTSHADDVSGGGSADYVEPPANAENISDGGAAPVVQHTDSEPVGNESDDSDAPSGYVGGTTDVDAGSADSEASPMDSNSTTVETQAPASRADRTVDTNDETAGEAGFDYAEPPADAGSASNDVATPSAQRTDSDATGEGNTGFAGGNGGGGNYSSDEETAPATQGAKAPADEGDSDIGEPPAKGESSSDVGGAAGRTTSSADDSDDSDDSDAGSGSFGGSNGSSHDENPGSGASGSGGDSNGGAAASAVQYQSGGDNSPDVGDSFTDNEGATASATAAPETQGNDAVSLANAGSGNESTIGQAAPTKASASTDTNTSKREEKAAQNDSQNSFDGNADGSDYSDSTAVKDSTPVHEQSVEKPPVDGTQFYADTSRGNSFATSGKSSTEPSASSAEYSASSGPEIRPLSHVSIKAFNDTNGFVESDGIGRIQVTRVSVDPDTGVTQWRIMQKLDADGNVPETPDVMNIERSAKYNKQTRRYEPETFEGIARQLGKVDDYESVGPDTDESYKRRNRNSSQDRTQSAARSDSQPQQKNAYEGKSFRERNSRNERNERNNRFQQMMQGNKNRSNGSKKQKG